jgi:hypothetical protein
VYASKRWVVLSSAPLLCALSAFLQADVTSIGRANQIGEEAMGLTRGTQIPDVSNGAATSVRGAGERQMFAESPAMHGNEMGEDSGSQPPVERLQSTKPPDLNRVTFITETRSSSRWTEDGCPSTFLFLSTFS